MKKIGLITLYNNNYGSILQCYATKTYIESLGYSCEVLFQLPDEKKKSVRKLKKICVNLYRCLRYKDYLKSKIRMRKAVKQEVNYLSEESLRKMNSFVDEKIYPKGYTWSELCDLGRRQEYVAFIVGSDQVWNASRGMEPFFFLSFAERRKRISLAASFGVKTIPNFNLKSVKKGLLGFDNISVREETGINIVEKLVNKKAIRLSDPTVLFNGDKWREFYKQKTLNYPYVLVHFLNEPSNLAIKLINSFCTKQSCKVICLAYRYKGYENLESYTFMDGFPEEYVSLIDNAIAVFTDSFHTTLFSMNLNSTFYTFYRQYLHGYSQSSRIIDLLKRSNLEYRLIDSEDKFWNAMKIKMVKPDDKLIQDKNRIVNYLKDIVLREEI